MTAAKSRITSEVIRDAPAIAQGIFGDNAGDPDKASIRQSAKTNRPARPLYQSGGQRVRCRLKPGSDPNQFVDVAKRIGVQVAG